MPGDIAVAERYAVLPDLVSREHHILTVAYDAPAEDVRVLLSRIAAFRTGVSYRALATINTFGTTVEFDQSLDELVGRGLLFHDRERGIFDYEYHGGSWVFNSARAESHCTVIRSRPASAKRPNLATAAVPAEKLTLENARFVRRH